jgi:hypothetical protein
MLPAIDGRLFKIKGGNFQLPERLIIAADAVLQTGVMVQKVHRTKRGYFELHVKRIHADDDEERVRSRCPPACHRLLADSALNGISFPSTASLARS